MVKTSLYPRAAAMKASAMPVLPDVGSTSVVLPGVIKPLRSASSIMPRPIRSFTLRHGSWVSSLTAMRAPLVRPAVTRLR